MSLNFLRRAFDQNKEENSRFWLSSMTNFTIMKMLLVFLLIVTVCYGQVRAPACAGPDCTAPESSETKGLIWDEQFGERFSEETGDLTAILYQEQPFTGVLKSCRNNEKLRSLQSYVNGLLEGINIDYHKNGQLKEKGSYRNRKKEGTWITYYSNGQMKSTDNMLNGLLVGESLDYHENGQLERKANYEKGKLTGELLLYYPNGQLKEKASYVNGEYNGPYLSYHGNGQPKERSVRKGEILGNDWDIESQIIYEGIKYTYHENGNLKMEYSYNKEVLQGKTLWYDEQGSVFRTVVYDKGFPISCEGDCEQTELYEWVREK